MAINGRTFQILYIIRELAAGYTDHMLANMLVEDDQPGWVGAKCSEVSDFIARRRNIAPTIYDKAYISPSALEEMVGRMASREGLLECHGLTYSLTVKGSAMADLLTDIDACSTRFLDNYKSEVCLAALHQQLRVGMNEPVDARQVAAVTGISLDSARRGLQVLAEAGLADEDLAGRSRLYSAVVQDDDVQKDEADTLDEDEQGPLDIDIEEEDDDDDDDVDPDILAAAQFGFDLARQPTPDAFVREALADLDERDILPDGETDRLVASVLRSRSVDSRPLTLVTPEDAGWDPSKDLPEDVADNPDALCVEHLDYQGCGDLSAEGLDDDEAAPEPCDSSWDNVGGDVREALFKQAEAAGMSLHEYLAYSVQANQERIQRSLFMVS